MASSAGCGHRSNTLRHSSNMFLVPLVDEVCCSIRLVFSNLKRKSEWTELSQALSHRVTFFLCFRHIQSLLTNVAADDLHNYFTQCYAHSGIRRIVYQKSPFVLIPPCFVTVWFSMSAAGEHFGFSAWFSIDFVIEIIILECGNPKLFAPEVHNRCKRRRPPHACGRWPVSVDYAHNRSIKFTCNSKAPQDENDNIVCHNPPLFCCIFQL